MIRDKKHIQELFEKACEVAAKQSRKGSADRIIVNSDVAQAIAEALKMRERRVKILKITKNIKK